MTAKAAKAQQDSASPVEPSHPVRKIMRIGFWLAKHLFILILVVLVPLVVFELVSLTALRDNKPLLMIGSVSWPLYAAWIFLKIRHERLRFILLQLLGVLSGIGLMALLASCAASDALMGLVRAFPVLLSLVPLPVLLAPALRRSEAFCRHWYIAVLICLPLALAFAALMTYGSHMCALAGTGG